MNLEQLFCLVDDFCKLFIPEWEKTLLSNGKRHRKRAGQLSDSELITIYLLFQSSGYRDFKHYYLFEVLQGKLKKPSLKQYLTHVLSHESLEYFYHYVHFCRVFVQTSMGLVLWIQRKRSKNFVLPKIL